MNVIVNVLVGCLMWRSPSLFGDIRITSSALVVGPYLRVLPENLKDVNCLRSIERWSTKVHVVFTYICFPAQSCPQPSNASQPAYQVIANNTHLLSKNPSTLSTSSAFFPPVSSPLRLIQPFNAATVSCHRNRTRQSQVLGFLASG